MTVWAFNGAMSATQRVYESVKSGKSRFGWSFCEENNLKLENNWTDEHAKNQFLLQVKPQDWIVHINTPQKGKCIAAQVLSEYGFDDGLPVDDHRDFRHYFEVDVDTIVEFDRGDRRISPSVNLKPRQRYQRVYEVDDFMQSIKSLQEIPDDQWKPHLQIETEDLLSRVTELIHKNNKAKKLESFLAKVFRRIPTVVYVDEHGKGGWRSDNGADLIVTLRQSMGSIEFENKVIVQIKSYEGEHYNLDAVQQVKCGIEHFEAAAGMIITTAKKTPELEDAVEKVSIDLDKPIDLIAGVDVARFVLRHAPDMVFNLDSA